eukprot:CAMPEP_0194779216 /NCGR_PEP_ID=MMETSP0323_2-20130528/70433_1 /TAXON_ID=2866 ORGANISM="Crypthecodinium cohnii, Strain Seligo" /NCGR_SAMPLE_ID=MMETSP0323_2 /ASSEMBLY_ACC=CAM_ASM_000346 /LENGTH=118 /DNA_ID=CAMNT_0039716753 /DNA_START=64 /DNA_END=416 /DNA_ORIENTATION=+
MTATPTGRTTSLCNGLWPIEAGPDRQATRSGREVPNTLHESLHACVRSDRSTSISSISRSGAAAASNGVGSRIQGLVPIPGAHKVAVVLMILLRDVDDDALVAGKLHVLGELHYQDPG